MNPTFPKMRCATFIVALALLFMVYNYVYSEYLWNKSRDIIIGMQA